jgi:hypothetical protein
VDEDPDGLVDVEPVVVWPLEEEPPVVDEAELVVPVLADAEPLPVEAEVVPEVVVLAWALEDDGLEVEVLGEVVEVGDVVGVVVVEDVVV